MVVPIVKRLTVCGESDMTDDHGATLVPKSSPPGIVLHEPAGLNGFFRCDHAGATLALVRRGQSGKSGGVRASVFRRQEEAREQAMRFAPLPLFCVANVAEYSAHDQVSSSSVDDEDDVLEMLGPWNCLNRLRR